MNRLCVFITLTFLMPLLGWAQLSKTHYVPPIGIDTEPYDQWIYLSTPSTAQVYYEIKKGDDTVVSSGYLDQNNPIVYQIPGNTYGDFIVPHSACDRVLNGKGYVIEASKPVYASVRVRSNDNRNHYHAGALVSKGLSGLGTKFRAGMFQLNRNSHSGFIGIMATENNTNIQIDLPAVATTVSSKKGSFSIALNKGESYVIASKGVSNNLIGTLVTSNKNIVVNVGAGTGTFSTTESGQDYGMDQLVDISGVGSSYILVRAEAGDSVENALIIADEDNTQLQVNGTNYGAPLKAGEYTIIEGNQYSPDGNMFIKAISSIDGSEKPVFTFQGLGVFTDPNNPASNQGMFFVPPLSCSARGDVDNIAQIHKIGNTTMTGGGVTVVVKNGASLILSDDNKPEGGEVASYPGVTVSGPNPVMGNSDYVTYKVVGLKGNVSVRSDDELYVAYYNYNGAATSGAFYSGFPSAPEINFEAQFETLGNCIPNITLSAANAQSFDSLEWLYDDGTGFQPISTNSEIVPTLPGQYKMIGVIACLSLSFESSEVTVSICPDDADADGIIDNLDEDNDNDGILNSDESRGTISLDFTDLNNPIASADNDGVNTGLIVIGQQNSTNVAGGTNTLEGFPEGLIRSTLSPSSDSQNDYQMTFDQKTHLRFEQNPQSNLSTIDAETFSVSVSPANKNITVVNPDNQLLIDTNFDGEYEQNIKQFSASTIRFKINSNASGSPTFYFTASFIDGFSIKHNSANVTQNAIFEGRVSLPNFPNFSLATNPKDDAFTLDSDADGCYDVTEAGFEDPDGDGILGTNPITINNNNGRVNWANSGYTSPADNNNNGQYDFQEAGAPIGITTEPQSTRVCVNTTASFTVIPDDSSQARYRWEIWDPTANEWIIIDNSSTAYSGAETNTLNITNATVSMDGNTYRVGIYSEAYACATYSISQVVLNVNNTPDPPTLEPIQTFCFSATVGDLQVITGENISWFTQETGGSALDPNTPLVNNNSYWAEASDSTGCLSTARTETKPFISSPSVTADRQEICFGEQITITVEGVAKTPQDFEIAHPELRKIATYQSSHYFVREASMSWEEAKALGDTYEGTSMYIINDANEEQAVYNSLQSLGLTGTDNKYFWLGLKQIRTASDYAEPAGGWYWTDGSPLTYSNWWSGEPNDWEGGEDYGQFEFSDNGIRWNDMANTNASGASWPLFEFTGTSAVNWGYIDTNGNDVSLPNALTSSIDVSPLTTTTYFVEVVTNGVVCRDEFTITVQPLPTISDVVNLEACDNPSTNNGTGVSFDLSLHDSTLLGTQNATDFAVSYHLNFNDANDNLNVINQNIPYLNIQNNQQIYPRITNKTTGCFVVGNPFELIVLPLPDLTPPTPLVVCDGTNDTQGGTDTNGFALFDLDQKNIEILNGQDPNNFKVSYHLTAADAASETAIGLSSPFENTQKDTQTLYVRVQNTVTNCIRSSGTLELQVAPLPTITNALIHLKQCDSDDNNDGVSVFNLTAYESDISLNASQEKFEYFQLPALTPIANPSQYANLAFSDSVQVRVKTNNGCERIAQINLKVGANLIPDTFMENHEVCEDSDYDNQDGIAVFSHNIFTDLRAHLMASDPKFSQFTAKTTFYESQEDALTKMNPIDESIDYTNKTPWIQEIWANIENEDLDNFECLGLKQVATLTVESLPIHHAVVINSQCDDGLDSKDGFSEFDTTNLIQGLLTDPATGVVQTGIDISFEYQDENGLKQKASALPNPFNTKTQTVTVNMQNQSGLQCETSSTLGFVVDETPQAYPVTIPPLCDDDADGDDTNGYVTFDTSSVLDVLLTDPKTGLKQTNLNVEFSYEDETGLNQKATSLPNPFYSHSQVVTATITNPINPKCSAIQNIQFVVNPLPDFQVVTTEIICKNLDPEPIGVSYAKEEYQYNWARNGVDLPYNTPTITIDEGGIYTITATTINGSNCSRTQTITVEESEIASVSADIIKVFDLTSNGNNSIAIDSTKLGIGNYEFSLNDMFGPYQDNPLFEQLKPGIHTLYVRDKNGCGVALQSFSIVGYSPFFTPNGDGYNDYWNVLGINADFQAASQIYIFDRYGKLLKQLSPTSRGWDGSFNGVPMPSDDYWFLVNLEDGRQFKGHFTLKR